MRLFEKKISRFPATLKWASEQDTEPLRRFLTEEIGGGVLFVGSGGSYSAAAFGELLVAARGVMARALTPYVYAGSGFRSVPAKTLLISAGGNNGDICRAYDAARSSGVQKPGALSLRVGGVLQDEFRKDKNDNLFAYQMPGGSDGFLSSNTVLSFYVLLAKALGYVGTEKLDCGITEKEAQEISAFVEGLKHIPDHELTPHQAYLQKLESVDSFFILYSAHGLPAALDLESKFSEGAIGNTQLADYRNFAHGRFNWFTQRPGQTGLICLQTPSDREMSEEIISMLPSHVPTLRISTAHDTPLAAVDLLIKGHYLCNALAARWDLNLARPSIPHYGRPLYRR